MAYWPAGQCDNGNLFGNDADELIIDELLEMDPQLFGTKMGMRGLAESQQWTSPWPQKSNVRPSKPKWDLCRNEGGSCLLHLSV